MLVSFESSRFRKAYFDFSIDTGIISLFHYVYGIWIIQKKHLTSMTVLKYDGVIKKSHDLRVF